MQLLTTAQVATELGLSRMTILRWVHSGKLTPIASLPTKTGAYLFDPADVSALIDEAHS